MGEAYYITPYLSVVKNKYQLISSLFFRKKQIKLELSNGVTATFRREKFSLVTALLGVVSFATSCDRKSDNEIEISFDMQNRFVIKLNEMSLEDEKLLALLYEGTLFGASFIEDDEKFRIPGRTIRIFELNGKKVIELESDLRFYLDSITPGIIIEAFIQKIHNVETSEDLKGKTVVDVGAECGDTAIFYANKGAIVYSFEPVKAHYDAMVRNISLNPRLAKQITPINAAIGKDGILKFYQSDKADIAEAASFVYNVHGEDVKISDVKGYSLKSAYSEFGLKQIDLLKMDCKGCEYFLSESDLENVSSMKIEYLNYDDSHKLEELLGKIKNAGFQYIIYRHIPFYYRSNLFSATIYAKKNKC